MLNYLANRVTTHAGAWAGERPFCVRRFGSFFGGSPRGDNDCGCKWPANLGLSPESCYVSIPLASSADECGTLRKTLAHVKTRILDLYNRPTVAARSNCQTFVGELATNVTKMEWLRESPQLTLTDGFRAACHVEVNFAL
jgi:hypothetical protein